eukprot:8439855-Karenia_brevis.AAC.1
MRPWQEEASHKGLRKALIIQEVRHEEQKETPSEITCSGGGSPCISPPPWPTDFAVRSDQPVQKLTTSHSDVRYCL